MSPPAGPAIVFDLFGTLTDWRHEARRQALCDELAAVLGADRGAFRAVLQATFTDRVTGRTGDTAATMAHLAGLAGVRPSPATLARTVERRLAHVRYLVAPSADALTALAALRAEGRRIGILSDCSSETPELWPSLPYAAMVDATVFSYTVGARKPDPRMYAAVADALGVEPGNCLYVGDGSSHELTGAQAAGMTVLMFDACPDPTLQYDCDDAWAGARITTLLDVARFPA